MIFSSLSFSLSLSLLRAVILLCEEWRAKIYKSALGRASVGTNLCPAVTKWTEGGRGRGRAPVVTLLKIETVHVRARETGIRLRLD